MNYAELTDRNFREDMHRFVLKISAHVRGIQPHFIVIPQNGHDLLLDNQLSRYRKQYLTAIDGIGQEDLNFGISGMNSPTNADTHNYMLKLLNTAKEEGKKVLIIDYCNKKDLIDNAYFTNNMRGFITFVATERDLTNIPEYPLVPYHMNKENITTLGAAQNFLYIINAEDFNSKTAFLSALRLTMYDLIVIDLFFYEEVFSRQEVASLKKKPGGADRIILAYMSIGEAETYRYYWQDTWYKKRPSWLDLENPDWPGNYKVRYWEEAWQELIISNKDSYLNRILEAGFDGVYLDIIDGFYYFEEVTRKFRKSKQ